MKNAKEFEERMHEEKFARLFSNAKSDEEIIKIAAEQGYDIKKEDIQNFEMTDEMLESVAGGKGSFFNKVDRMNAGGSVNSNSNFNLNGINFPIKKN